MTASQINKAARTIRRVYRSEEVPRAEVREAIALIREFRAVHAYPLTKANMGLRSMVRTERCDVEVSQRLKRLATILDKIGRESTMRLASMQDVGGCRAVLGSIDEVRRVQRRLIGNRPPLRVRDYIEAPRDSGYRGVHVVVCYGDPAGLERAIEVQLRTRVMHEWAITVERLSGRMSVDLKSGVGPPDVLDLLGAISEAMAIEERGEEVPETLLGNIEAYRAKALPLIIQAEQGGAT